MGFYVMVHKTEESSSRAEYEFGPDEQHLGKLLIRKDTGSIEQLDAAPVDNARAVFARAATKIRQAWRSGTLPERTCWAS